MHLICLCNNYILISSSKRITTTTTIGGGGVNTSLRAFIVYIK